jgi:Lactate dehydrogenase and related dehydrogenases
MSTSSNNKQSPESDDSSPGAEGSSAPVTIRAQAGKIQQLKEKEAALSRLLAAVRREKLSALRSRPLTIGIVGFGRFGQFIARTFAQHGKVIATSRSDYTDLAMGMGIEYVSLSNPALFLEKDLDVIVLATSIVSFEGTVKVLCAFGELYTTFRNW